MTEFTAHFRLPVPDFTQEPWHDQFRDLCVAIDAMAFDALLTNAAAWANSTPYAVGQIVIDDVTNGQLYTCAIAHVSPAAPTLFVTFRNANPGHWNAVAQLPRQRGTWTTATTYITGDFVVDNNRYAVCVISHISTVFNTDLAAGRWVVLIDISAVGSVGINAQAEATIAAAPTVNLGAATSSTILISGSGQTISSFGVGANLFKIVRFNGTNTIVHNGSSLILLSGENRLTAGGDSMFLRSDGAGNWRERTYYTRASETSKGVVRLATNAEAIAGTSAIHALTPLRAAALWNTLFNTYFPSGTRILMQQTTPPVGWTKETMHHDVALRVVAGTVGTGGVNAFSLVFGQFETQNFTLTTLEMPVHDHVLNDPQHSHTWDAQTIEVQAGTGAFVWAAGGVQNTNAVFIGIPDTEDAGSSGGHKHAMDIRVAYVDAIIAIRNA